MIRNATLKDKQAIAQIYDAARKFMAESGNPTQWGKIYPYDEMIEEDIEKKNLYAIEENSEIHGVFAFILGVEEAYANIDGEWLDNSSYGTIHRLASDGKIRGVYKACLEFCKNICSHIRIDTHENNKVMRKLIAESGFTYCGIVHDEDRVRLAYEMV